MAKILTPADADYFKVSAAYPLLTTANSPNDKVPLVKSILRSQGGWTGSDSKDFGPKLKSAVQYFQSTHLGPNGVYLKGDGEVGPATWWALHNPSGAAQSSNLQPIAVVVPGTNRLEAEFKRRYGKLPESRQKFLRVLWEEYLRPVKEIPDGSNAGPDVDKYTKGFGAVYWCALYQSWCFNKAMGFYHKGTRRAGVMDWFNSGLGKWSFPVKSDYKPKPGDLMCWRFAKGSGHISAIVALNMAGDKANTLGGNESNRVKLGFRDMDAEPQLAGYINLFDDMKTSMSFATELLSEADKDSITSGGTR